MEIESQRSELDELIEWLRSRIQIFHEPKTKTEIGGKMALLAVLERATVIRARRQPMPEQEREA